MVNLCCYLQMLTNYLNYYHDSIWMPDHFSLIILYNINIQISQYRKKREEKKDNNETISG